MSDFPEVPGWTPPSAAARYDLLRRTRSIAMVGASSNPARASNFVLTYLLSSSADYTVYPISPRGGEILGQKVYPSLADLPEVPDMVDVFRRPDDLPGVAEEAVAMGAKSFWVQLGLWSVPAAQIALDGGLEVVMNRCLKIEHARFHGGLHLAGFDTGVITSKHRRTG